MKRKATYGLFNCFNASKGLITFFLLLAILAKPVVSTFFPIAEMEYELCESSEERESKEKENTSDSEEDPKHYYSIPDCEFHTNHNPSLFVLHKDLISSHVDIPEHPPDRS